MATPQREIKHRFVFDERALRYRGPGGRFVPKRVITNELEKVRAEAKARVLALSQQLQAGSINLSQWQLTMRDTIKAMHTAAAAAARGGWDQMSPRAWGQVGAHTRQQYEWLNRFSLQLEQGLPMNGRFLRRAQMYIDASRMSFSESEKAMQRAAGTELAKRELHAKESCAGCVDAASLGFVPIDELPEIGGQECLSNCLCEVVYKEAA